MAVKLKSLLKEYSKEWAGYCPKCGGRECKCEQAFGFVEESDASQEAKELNLVHVGFGNYAQKEGGAITHRTINGKLVRVGEAPRVADPKIVKKTGEEDPEKSMERPEYDIEKQRAKRQKIGVTDIKLVDEENQIYTFRYNGNPGRIKLTKKERVRLEKDDITNIILDRIKRKIARLKAAEKAQADAELANRKS